MVLHMLLDVAGEKVLNGSEGPFEHLLWSSCPTPELCFDDIGRAMLHERGKESKRETSAKGE